MWLNISYPVGWFAAPSPDITLTRGNLLWPVPPCGSGDSGLARQLAQGSSHSDVNNKTDIIRKYQHPDQGLLTILGWLSAIIVTISVITDTICQDPEEWQQSWESDNDNDNDDRVIRLRSDDGLLEAGQHSDLATEAGGRGTECPHRLRPRRHRQQVSPYSIAITNNEKDRFYWLLGVKKIV